MIREIYDFFFTRRIWEVVETKPLFDRPDAIMGFDMAAGKVFLMRDQFGNINKKIMRY